VPEGIRSGADRVVIAEVKLDDDVRLNFTVDTDDPLFISHGNARPGDDFGDLGRVVSRADNGVKIRTQIYGYALARVGGEIPAPRQRDPRTRSAAPPPTVAQEPLRAAIKCLQGVEDIELLISPAYKLKRFDGYVALDLGTTNSTIACMDKRCANVEDIQVVEAGSVQEGSTIQTALRIQRYTEPEEKGKMPPAACKFGQTALDATSGELVLGAKRLLADPRQDEKLTMQLEGHTFQISKRLPAELFIASMFKGFAKKTLGVASKSMTAITHPITFSSREIGQLRQAVHDGWRRSWGAEQYTPYEEGDGEAASDSGRFLTIDEASAAAIFFLYKDFLHAPGRMRVFHYLYPRGLNLLLYDCGGGTTDIALVQAKPVLSDTGRLDTLTIDVKGRTGKRDFGGDTITGAVFWILKAQFACALASGRFSYPADPAKLKDFLCQNWIKFDEVVPTRFSDNDAAEDRENRKAATLDLWKIAEWVKMKLGEKSPILVKDCGFHPEKSTIIYELVSAATGLDAIKCHEILGKLSVDMRHVDAIIEKKALETIEVANNMLDDKLARQDPDGEVHRVYVVGNASRYPLIRELIKRELRVRFIEERLVFDEKNLKNSVAKGAVLASRLEAALAGVDIEWDRKLSDRLPFDVMYDDLTLGERAIFREHTHYKDLDPVHIDGSKAKADERSGRTQLLLYRHWPGSKTESKAYFSFEFPSPVNGPVEVKYDAKTRKFLMSAQSDRAAEPVEGKEIAEESIYRAPAQLGDVPAPP
ncbi:MAG: hypothetical protein NTY19_17495, partial [Planctomycetota bacterium]|nr:hypothetical protein [Planctomycetota bacterium]